MISTAERERHGALTMLTSVFDNFRSIEAMPAHLRRQLQEQVLNTVLFHIATRTISFALDALVVGPCAEPLNSSTAKWENLSSRISQTGSA